MARIRALGASAAAMLALATPAGAQDKPLRNQQYNERPAKLVVPTASTSGARSDQG
jgi:hypothetical protein